jgi:Tfp pilus assembly protein PilF
LVPDATTRHVQTIELHPGNRSVHHTFVLLDRSRNSRRVDALDAGLGFPGMTLPGSVQAPPGQFVSWQPGKLTHPGSAETIWTLEPNTDLVIQMHMQPTGKPETVQASVGLYFTNTPPAQTLFKVGLSSYAIDIPAGATNYLVQDTFTLPVDVEVLALLPHAHNLGREVHCFGTLPGGKLEWLLRIKDWDFNWQGDYRCAKPVALPKGTILTMQWVFDNSTNNVRNPHQPPVRVRYGQDTTNEMAELWIQLRLRGPQELALLQQEYGKEVLADILELNRYRLSEDPNDVRALNLLGQALHYSGNLAEAEAHLRRATTLDPGFDEAHFNLGLLLREQKRFPAARDHFEAALKINPENIAAHNNLGFVFAELGQPERAAQHFESARRLDPDDAVARESLAELRRIMEERAARR